MLGEAAEVRLGSGHQEPCMSSCDARLFRAVSQSDLHLESCFCVVDGVKDGESKPGELGRGYLSK